MSGRFAGRPSRLPPTPPATPAPRDDDRSAGSWVGWDDDEEEEEDEGGDD